MINESASDPAPLSASASIPTTAKVAKHSAHATGIASTTANARIAARATHSSSGITHSATASGIATNTSAVLALVTILHINKPRNSSPAPHAITIAKKFTLTAAANATPSSRLVSSSTLPLPSNPRAAALLKSAACRNSHGHATTNNAAATVRPSPSSASKPPDPLSPAAQYRNPATVPTAANNANAIADVVDPSSARLLPARPPDVDCGE